MDSKKEMKELVTICGRFSKLKHFTSMPYAFTEFGVSMLPDVLGGFPYNRITPKVIVTFGVIKRGTDVVRKGNYYLMGSMK